MDFRELIERAPEIVSVAGALGIALLLPLFLAQRRDIRRLRIWSERDSSYPAENLVASEAILDRAEAELERVGGGAATGSDTAVGLTPAGGPTPAGSLPAATRVTSERPALERVTMERAALEPHPRWRRFLARATQPRVLVVLGIVALLLAAGGIFVSQAILDDSGDDKGPKAAKIDPSEVTVAVLNGTAQAGLADKVGNDVAANDYQLGTVGGTSSPFEETMVLFANGQRAAGRKVARDLGVDAAQVAPIDRETKLLDFGDADVVVIVGEDRAKP